jgi:hypothetical protein
MLEIVATIKLDRMLIIFATIDVWEKGADSVIAPTVSPDQRHKGAATVILVAVTSFCS